MSKATTFLPSLAVLAMAAALAGCSGAEESTPPAASDQSQAADDASHEGHQHAEQAAHEQADPQIQAALAQLSEEDRAAAEKQKICPVSLQPLGGMGKPCKITVTTSDGQQRDVFLCCQGCESAIKGDPDKYLANLTE